MGRLRGFRLRTVSPIPLCPIEGLVGSPNQTFRRLPGAEQGDPQRDRQGLVLAERKGSGLAASADSFRNDVCNEQVRPGQNDAELLPS